MRKFFNILLLVALLALGAKNALGFALMGPLPADPGGETWQVGTIGYALAYTDFGGPGGRVYLGDIGGPHNIGEEYRRNTPFLYYAYDANFLGYFGLAGTTNADAAAGIMNSLTNLSSYSPALNEFPPDSQSLNPTAQALYLLDLKSVTLHLLVEQLGLIEPERFTWTLHDRSAGPACPVTTTYLVVQRNFDVVDTPFNQVQYSPYVNDVLYSYYVSEVCSGSPVLARTHPFSVDPLAKQYTAVAANDFDEFGGLQIGGFYTGLTKDDVGGLRYLMNSNNINFEATLPSGALLLATNLPVPVNVTTLPFSLLFSQSVTNDPDTLRTNFPGIAILSVITNIVSLPTTNIIAYFTNLAGPYTNRVPLSNNVAIYPAQGNTVPFTNWTPVQYGDPPILITTRPLAPLLYLSQFLSPLELQVLYPDVLIDRVLTNYLAIDISTNIFPYFTNQSVLPVFNYVSNGLPRVTTLTNIYFFTNQPGPTVINYDFTQFSTISTLDLALFSDRAVTNDPATMVALYPGLVILHFTALPAFIGVTNYISYLTNYTGSPYQGPPKLVTLAVSTNFVFVTNYLYSFGNVFTNHFYTNRTYKVTSIWITNQIGAPYGSPFIGITNSKTYTTNKISGDFFIFPTNWCGFDLRLAYPLGNPPQSYSATNTYVFAGYGTNGSVGTNAAVGGNAFGLTQSYYYQFTNYTYAVNPGICQPVLQFGTNYSTNAIYKYQYNFINVITNHYYTNSLINLFITNVYAIPGNPVDVLGTNIFNTSYYTNLPGGDFYTVPNTWCGYQIVALLTNLIAPTNIVFTNSNLGTNLQYTYVQYLVYTNYTYSIRPGFCEPRLDFSTNYSTNIVTQYHYFFGNIITNNFYTNGQARVITTNISLVPGGFVGQLVTNITTNFVFTGPDGDFTPIPPAWCDYKIIATQSVAAVYTTNTFTATNLAPPPDLGEMFTQTTVYGYTNKTLLIQPYICNTVTSPPALRQGIERVQFIRANYDSLLGQFFQPITNRYTLTMITNSQLKTEFFQRVITQPDILLSAQDLAVGPAANNFNGTVVRSIRYDSSQVLNNLRGPGTIVAPSILTYNKVGPIFENGPFSTVNFLDQINQVNQLTQVPVLQWGSYDGSTNTPILYPNGASILNLANSIFIQVSPSTVPDGTVGAAYNSGAGVTFSATGGQSPYTWAIPNLPSLVPGMTFNTNTATMTGTPVGAGVFSFAVQVTDSVNRVVNINYSITIH